MMLYIPFLTSFSLIPRLAHILLSQEGMLLTLDYWDNFFNFDDQRDMTIVNQNNCPKAALYGIVLMTLKRLYI